MAKSLFQRVFALQQQALDFIEERTVDSRAVGPALRAVRTVAQFVFLLVRGFTANRCPVRAAALCYTTLLALVPLLAVTFWFAQGFLQDSAQAVPQLIDTLVARVAPQLEILPATGETNAAVAAVEVKVSDAARRQVVEQLQSFIGNIDANTLGTVGMVALIFVAIQLLMTIEQAFNDIWGVSEGRSIWRKVVYYWAAVSLGPLVLFTAIALTGRAEFATAVGTLAVVPGAERVVMAVTPYVVLWVGFALLYGLMPNTAVRWQAAAIGGIAGGTLWQLNSLLSTMYFSRVLTYSKIYGGLGVIPVLLLGLYFSWLIVLFGAQVAFAAQNYRVFIQQRASERVDEAGREWVACRLVMEAARAFVTGLPAPSPSQLAEQIGAPLQLVNQLWPRLAAGGVLALTAGSTGGLTPARPPETITVADVLRVVRTDNVKCGETPPINGDPVRRLLAELDAATQGAPANRNFRELVDRQA